MSPWTNKGKNTGYLVAPSKVTLVFKLSAFNDIPMLDTTSGAQILRGADQAGHKMEVDMQSHPHQIVSINLVAFIKQFLDVWFCNFEKPRAAWACSDVRAFFWAVLLAEPEGPPTLSAAGGVVGVRGRRCCPPAAVPATAPTCGGDGSWGRGGAAALDVAAL